jgi:hypothetical protein
MDWGKLSSYKVIPVVKQLLFTQAVAGEANLNHRNGGGRIDDNQGWGRARREESKESLGNCGRLRQGSLNVGAGLKKNLNDGHARQGLRFDMLHIVNQDVEAPFDVRGDALLHFLRLEAIVVPDHADYGDIDFRKNVRRRAQEDEGRQQDDDECHHDKCVGPR